MPVAYALLTHWKLKADESNRDFLASYMLDDLSKRQLGFEPRRYDWKSQMLIPLNIIGAQRGLVILQHY